MIAKDVKKKHTAWKDAINHLLGMVGLKQKKGMTLRLNDFYLHSKFKNKKKASLLEWLAQNI